MAGWWPRGLTHITSRQAKAKSVKYSTWTAVFNRTGTRVPPQTEPMARWPDSPMARWPDGTMARWPDGSTRSRSLTDTPYLESTTSSTRSVVPRFSPTGTFAMRITTYVYTTRPSRRPHLRRLGTRCSATSSANRCARRILLRHARSTFSSSLDLPIISASLFKGTPRSQPLRRLSQTYTTQGLEG